MTKAGNDYFIIKVEDLLYLLNNTKEQKSFLSQKYFFQQIAKLKVLSEEFKIQENLINGVDIIKYKKVVQEKSKKKTKKTKQEQAVLILTSKIKNIPKLIDILNDDYVGINIFAKNEK